MVTLTEEERKQWYPAEYAAKLKEEEDKKVKNEKMLQELNKPFTPKVKDIFLNNSYTCQDCGKVFSTWREFTIVLGVSPTCDECKKRETEGRIRRPWANER
jgi:predicted SprT family Zn-dependent metalloprotease